MSPCPAPDTLVAFHLGKLPLSGLEEVAAHLSSCPQCEALLQHLSPSAAQDPLLANLKHCLQKSLLSEDPACARLRAAARGIEVTPNRTGGSTAADTPVPDIAELPLPRAVGAYQILGRIGHGGMGVVYRARQLGVNRTVALKMILAGAHAAPQAVARFRTEVQAVARVQHPHVVQVFEFGEYEGMPYYSMEMIEGGSLADKLAHGPVPPRAAAEILRTLAATIAHAHERHVLHRDLKPSNILLTREGTPKITDFGLAKLLDEEHSHTRSDLIVGTPSYMAPEQAAGKPEAIGPAADIYALGVILYEALTGRPPFKEGSRAALLEKVCHAEPLPPSKRRQEVPRDLEAVCLKCLKKAPGQRYASAQALAEDLDRWLQGEPTLARPPRWPERAWRAVRRHKVLTGCLLTLAAGLLALLWYDPNRPLREIEAQLDKGQPVTLIGETGPPNYMRVLLGQDRTSTNLAPDQSFSVTSWSVCLIELVPNSRQDRYRLSGRVRHEQSDFSGSVGFFFGRHSKPGTKADLHVFAQYSYNDMRSAKEFLDTIGRRDLPVPKGNVARLIPRLYGEFQGKSIADRQAVGVGGPPFQPANSKNQSSRRWRDLEVIVTPSSIKASWDGQPLPELTMVDCTKNLADTITRLSEKRPEEKVLREINPGIDPRGSLGLYLFQGSASFSDVKLVPLPPDSS